MPRLKGLFAQSQPPGIATETTNPKTNSPATLRVMTTGVGVTQVPPGANYVQFAPNTEERVMVQDRVTATYQPDPSYANIDPQIGGAPGDPGGSGGISTVGPTGITTPGGIPTSPYVHDWGEAEWTTTSPTWVPHHQTIVRWSNPNRPQVNPTDETTQGPMENTYYASPGPWAQGHYLET